MKPIRTFDGSRFTDIEGFYDEVERVLLDKDSAAVWGRNLDAFNDILRGGWGTPAENWTFRWIRADLSERNLGKATFDTLVEIISYHGVGGTEAISEIELAIQRG